MASSPRLVFMGSPAFAVPTLRALAERYHICGVISQPDRPSGRGGKLSPPPVKVSALALHLPVLQPEKLRAPEAMRQLRLWQPDLIVVAAYGQILKPEVLELPTFGCINVHGSLLPRWRGAAPIQAAILAGDEQTGVTIMKMDAGIDTGAMLAKRPLPISAVDTSATLFEKLATLGAQILLETLPAFLRGEIHPQPQSEQEATYAPMLKKENGLLDFSRPAEELARQVRAFNPWPGTWLEWDGQPLKIHLARAEEGNAPPGQRIIHNKQPAIGTAQGLLILEEVQPAGKKPMPGKSFLAGARNW